MRHGSREGIGNTCNYRWLVSIDFLNLQVNKEKTSTTNKSKNYELPNSKKNMNNQSIHKILAHPFIDYTKYHLKYIWKNISH